MSRVNPVMEVMHRIKVKLYPNYLRSIKGAYLARTVNEASLSIEQICAALKNRGGFTGSYEDLVEYVTLFFDEAVYQLCNGYAVNTGFFSIHPNVRGTFDSEKDTYDREKNPITFHFRIRRRLRELAEYIAVEIEGIAEANCWIDEFHDTDKDSINTLYAPGDLFVIQGSKIKLAGDDPGVGVYFIPVDDPSKAVKAGRIVGNTSSKIIGVAPNTGYQHNKVEIRTQFAGSGGIFLKSPRVVTGSFVLEEL
jgi:hypothetical protein